MAQLEIPISKGKDAITITDEMVAALDEATYREVMFQGLKQVLNRNMSKITAKTTKDAEEMKSLAMAAAQKNVEALTTGKLKTSGKKAKKASGAEMTEARRIARNLVKDAIKAAGMKVSHIEASEITKAANALIEKDATILEQAKANILAREAKIDAALPIDVSAIPVSQKLVAAAEAKKAKDGTQSAKQAGMPKITKPKASKPQAPAQA